MQTQQIVTWIKLFVVSFVVVAVGRTWFEQALFGFTKSSNESIILFAGFIAVAIATAQLVLSPKPKPRVVAPPAYVIPAPQAPLPSEPVYKTSAKKKAKPKRRK